jgi:hypothetical protein
LSDTWHQEYQKLTSFISSHPEIVITQGKIVIPKEVREDFYSLFNKVRETFTEENCSTIIEESQAIAEEYNRAVAEAIGAGYIEAISASVDFDRFVQNPRATLIRPLFDTLFNLLKGKISDKDFKGVALNTVESFTYSLQKVAYEKWIILSLVNLLKPDELYTCSVQQMDKGRASRIQKLDQHNILQIPLPQRTSTLSWESDASPQIILPDFIIRSSVREQNKYIAVSSEFKIATNETEEPSSQREWLPVGTIFKVGSDVILIYMSDNLQNISLVANAKWFCKPDLFIKYRVNKNQDLGEWLEAARINSETLQPRLGFRLVSRVP